MILNKTSSTPTKFRSDTTATTYSTPEKRDKTSEKIDDIIQPTPKASKRKSRLNSFDEYWSPTNNNGNKNLAPIVETSFLDEDSNSQKNKTFFEKLQDSQYKPQRCYQLLHSDDEPYEKHNKENINRSNIPNKNLQNPNGSQQQKNGQNINFHNYHEVMKNQNGFKPINHNVKKDALQTFIDNYNSQNNNIVNQFSINGQIEVLGESIYSVNDTLKAFAQNISKFSYDSNTVQRQDFEGNVIYSVQGQTYDVNNKVYGQFIMSAKTSQNQDKIEYLKVALKQLQSK